MQLLKGHTLADHLAANGLLPEEESLHLLDQIADALQASHEEGLIHRDLKPGNIFIVSDDGIPRAVVADFGLAFRTTSVVEIADPGTPTLGSRSILGTPAYMPLPNNWRGGR